MRSGSAGLEVDFDGAGASVATVVFFALGITSERQIEF